VKVQKYQANDEKTLLTALIVSDRVLGTVAREIGKGPDPFKSKWSNIVARWCFDYHHKHGRAPGRLIQELFVRYAQREDDQGAVELVERFLGTLSDKYKRLSKEINERWVLDRAAEHFEKVRLENAAEKIQLALERHDVEMARKFLREAGPVSFSEECWLNPFARATVADTVDQMEFNKPLIQFRGDLGRFLSPYFERDAFISFAAMEKKGKSYWLMEVAWQALQQRRRVLYYVLGDMSARQVYHRLYSRMTGKPEPKKWLKNGHDLPAKLRKGPKDENTGKPTGLVDYDTVKLRPLNVVDVNRAIKLLKTRTAMSANPLRLKCAGANTVSASDIEADIIKLSDEGWPPDVVIVDYADLLLPEPSSSRLDFRHQINESWKVMRRISTDHHLLLVTATQAAARSYDQWVLRKKDFSEDKRKNAHVTGMVGINQTPTEKDQGLYRLNWIFLRDGTWGESQVCWTAGNLAIANPCIKSLI
jgi:hypothetical protein